NRHWARGARIALRESTSTQDALSDCRKIMTANPVPRYTFRLRSLWITPSFYGNQFIPVIAAERTVGRQACALHIRQPDQSIFDCAIKHVEVFGCVTVQRRIDLNTYAILDVKTKVLTLQIPQADRQQSGAGQQNQESAAWLTTNIF